MTAFFPEGTGGVTGHNTHGNSGGVGLFFVPELEIPRRGKDCVNFPQWWGMDIFWSYTFPKYSLPPS